MLALGSVDPGHLTKDRGALDMARFHVSRPAVVGTPLGQVTFSKGVVAKIAEVRRGDALIFPAPALALEYGDRVGVIAPREAFPGLRQHFGDSMKATTQFSYASMGLGMSLGVRLGSPEIPIPGVGSFSLGLAGGRSSSRSSSIDSEGSAPCPGTSRCRRISRCATSG